ncbi:LysR family transcriptional regulator [Pelagibius sp. Alg239-R121]|uniref:LysR family transcriptional regulator n=1 Tax=Pelagibius sp. Alg239-R121 TaxID=2993448 RepID=UPI0024A69A05|nr:LysR family transcriptional regulator [Pelagibius sp. Alg239-R121]
MRRSSFDFNLMRALEVFAAIVETRNITKAAQMLGITQSAASQHLGSLERAFATKLIDRYARPIELTKSGVVLHGKTGLILSEVEDLRSKMRRVESAPVPYLRVGMLASIATTLMPVVTEFAKRQAIPEVACFAGLASDHTDLLRNRRADMVVTSDALYDTSGLERFHIMSEAFLLITPRGFTGPKDDLAELAQQLPLARFSDSTPVGRRIDQHLRRLRLDLVRVMQADRASMVTAAVHAGHAFAIMSPTLLLDAVQEGMKLEISPLPVVGFRREITVVSRARELGDLPERMAVSIAERLQQTIGDLGALCAEASDFGEAGPMDKSEAIL